MKTKHLASPAIIRACAQVGEQPSCRIVLPNGHTIPAHCFTDGTAKLFCADGRKRYLDTTANCQILCRE